MKHEHTTKVNRELGPDLIKLLACLGVVALHTVNPGKGEINRAITLLAGMSIPLFFMVSGYLMFRKETLAYKYVLRKIFRILLVCLTWEFLHAVAYFLYYRQTRNFLSSFVLDFFQRGLFFHFWYMGALILMYLAMPPLHKLLHRSKKAYQGVLISLSAMCAVIDIISILMRRHFVLDIPQNLRVWTWLLYTMAGGYLAAGTLTHQFAHLKQSVKYIIVLAAAFLAGMWQLCIGLGVFGAVCIEAFYGSLPVQFGTFFCFLWLLGMQFSKNGRRAIAHLTSLTMGVYIMHPFVLAVLKNFFPVFVDAGMLINLLFWILTTALCCIGTEICKRIPIIKELLKL